MNPLNLSIVVLVALLTSLASAAGTRTRAIRGKSRSSRVLKKDDGNGKQSNPYQVLESAFEEEEIAEEPQKFNYNDEDEEEVEQYEFQETGEYAQPPQVANAGFGVQKEDNKNDKDNGRDEPEEVEEPESFVRIPELYLSLRFDGTPTSRTGAIDHVVIQPLITKYFENLLPKEMMGYNYISCDLEARTVGQSYDMTQMDFVVNGRAEYNILDGSSLPKEKQVKERLVAFFIDWGFDNGIGYFLNTYGIERATASNFFVNGIQMPAFVQANTYDTSSSSSTSTSSTTSASTSTSSTTADSSTTGSGYISTSTIDSSSNTFDGSTTVGSNTIDSSTIDSSNLGDSISGSSSTTTITSERAAPATEQASGGGKRVGLITGLTLFFVSLIVAGLLLWSTRRDSVTELFGKDKKSSEERRWWKDFQEDGSDTAAPPPRKVPQLNPYEDSFTSLRFKWSSWFPNKGKEEEEEELELPPDMLAQIQVVVDSDHILKKGGGGYRNYTLPPEEASAAIVSHQHSAATVPHSNFGGSEFDYVSPQKTAATSCPSDEDEVSLPSPVGKWEPPTRSTSKMYQERRRRHENRRFQHEKSDQEARGASLERNSREPAPEDPPLEDVQLSPKQHKSPLPTPPPAEMEVEDDCIGIADWTTYLNPCMLPHLPMFQYESERLDDLVATASCRQRSILDNSDDSGYAPPARRSGRSSSRGRRSKSNGGDGAYEF